MAQIFVKLRFQLWEYEAENYPEKLVEIILVQRKSILVQRKSVASNGSLVAFQPGNIAKQSCQGVLSNQIHENKIHNFF